MMTTATRNEQYTEAYATAPVLFLACELSEKTRKVYRDFKRNTVQIKDTASQKGRVGRGQS